MFILSYKTGNDTVIIAYTSKTRCVALVCDYIVKGKFFDNQGVVLKDEFNLSTKLLGSQKDVSICNLQNNKILFVWSTDFAQDGSGVGIFARITDLLGNFLSDEFTANKTTSGDQSQPSCTELGNNCFIIIYESGTDILGRIFNIDLTVFKEEFIINTTKTDNQRTAKILSLVDGNFIVGWESNLQDSLLYGLYYQKFSEEGNLIGSETQANNFTFQDQSQISLAQLRSGVVAIAFTSYGDSDQTGIYYEFIGTCQDGRFKDTNFFNRCSACDHKCATCDNQLDCLKCVDGYYALEDFPNKCVKTCPSGYLLTPKNGICKNCGSACLTCLNDFNICKTCNANYSLAEDITNHFTCLNNLEGYYLDSSVSYYKKCSVNCSTCTSSALNCLSCNSGLFYYPMQGNSSSCYIKTSSPNGYFFNTSSLAHTTCDVSCLTCETNDLTCLTCNSTGGFYNTDENPNSCLNTAPVGYVLDSVLKKYVKCDISCKACTTNKTNCQICNTDGSYFPLVDNISTCISIIISFIILIDFLIFKVLLVLQTASFLAMPLQSMKNAISPA